MSSGIIGVMTGSASITYTPATASKVNINYNSPNTQSALYINGFAVALAGLGFLNFTVGARQSVVITVSGSMGALVSCVEEGGQ